MDYIEGYNKFIIEKYSNKTRTSNLSMDEIVNLFNDKCSDWDLDSPKQIWRSSLNSHNLFYINPKNHGYRYSANSEGLYHSILPNLESWKFAPKRNESIIMSTNRETASNFNNESPYLMIPFNNTKMAITDSDDLWISGKRIRKLLGDGFNLGDDIEPELINFLKYNLSSKFILNNNGHKFFKKEFTEKNVIDMINYIDSLDKNKLIRYWDDDDINKYEIIDIWINKYNSLNFSDFLNFFFDFYSNDFKIIYEQSELINNVEIWSSGEFIGISEDFIKEFKEKINISH